MTSVTSIFSCTLPFPHYYPISDLTQSSVTSVMSMFSFILTLLVIIKFPTSYNIRDIRDVNVHLHPYFSRYQISDFTHHPWHPWCQWSTSSQPSVMIKSPIPAGRGTIMTLDIKFRISAGRRRIMTHEHQISDLRSASQDQPMTWTRHFHIKVFDLRSASQDHTV